MFAVPALLGTIGPLAGLNTPQEMSITGTFINRSTTTLESAQLSELRTGSTPTRDFSLSAEVAQSPAFVWPAHGPLTSYMDYTHPMGIDIALDHEVDSPIVAMARGVVSFSGSDHGYGYFVKVDHGGGLVTLYAHLSEILVETGQPVAQGEILGWGGSTGKSTGKHLHFEVRQSGFLADPLELLWQQDEELQTNVSCDTGALVMGRGGIAQLDFANGMPSTARITAVTLRPHAESNIELPTVELMSDKSVRVETLPYIDSLGVVPDAWYALELTIEDMQTFQKTCNVQVKTFMGYLTAFSEATYAAETSGSHYETEWAESDDSHYEAPVEEPIEEETATPEEEATVELTPEVTETPFVIPSDIPLLGDLTSPTPEPTSTSTATSTSTPEATATPLPTETTSPTPEATASPAVSASPSATAEASTTSTSN